MDLDVFKQLKGIEDLMKKYHEINCTKLKSDGSNSLLEIIAALQYESAQLLAAIDDDISVEILKGRTVQLFLDSVEGYRKELKSSGKT